MAGPIEGVIFDWGGTLSVHAGVDLADMWVTAAGHLAASHPTSTMSEAEHAEAIRQRLTEVEQESWERVSVDQVSTRISEILADASAALGMDVTEAVLEEAATHHLDTWTDHISHHPDAVIALTELKQRGLRMALLSNTHWPRAFHERFLERDGLAALLDVRCYTSEMERTKPHADAFTHAMGAAGLTDPSRVVFVGDRPYDDIWGAQQVGMRAVLRHNPLIPGYDVEPDATISSLEELPALIDQWSD